MNPVEPTNPAAPTIPLNCILVIGATHQVAMNAATALTQLIANSKAAGFTNGVMVVCCGLGVEEMRALLNDANTKPLPEFIRKTERKLFVAFDSEGNDLLAEIAVAIKQSPEMIKWAQKNRVEVMQMSEIVTDYCREHNLTRIWVQKPLIGSFDMKLNQRLEDAGLEICCLDETVEKYSDMRAVRATTLDDMDPGTGMPEAEKFWAILDPEFERLSVQAAFIRSSMFVLVDQREKSGKQPVAHDTDLMYADAVLTWTEQPQ